MALADTIRTEWFEARKKRADTVRINILTVLLNDAERLAKDQGRPATDDEVVMLVRRLLKGISETLGILEDRERSKQNYEAWKRADHEKTILESFLPEQLSEADILAVLKIICDKLDASSPKDMGKVMKSLKDIHGASVDMKLASNIARQILTP